MAGVPVESVFFNDGENEDVFALVLKDDGDTKLNLYVIPDSGEPHVANGVPLRDKKDYGPEGGGDTYHL